MPRLEQEPTAEALCEANIIDLRDWLAEHFDDTARTLLAPMGGWPLVEINPDESRACGFVILVRGVGEIRVALRVEVAQEDDED